MGILGGIILFLYGIVATYQTATFGRVYAAYGGIFILLSVLWAWKVDNFKPDRYDIIGALVALIGVFIIFYTPRSTHTIKKKSMNTNKSEDACKDDCVQKELSCKLTTPELRKRKETVIASLKKQVIEKKELVNGYSYQFKGSDALLDELTEFIKTERVCCDFFDFGLSVKGDASLAILTITGPGEAKHFITSELEL